MSINICSVGDVAFQGRFSDSPSIELFGPIVKLLYSADVTIANLENPLLDNGVPVCNKLTLRGSVEWARVLKQAGINIVSLANNHMMDFGPAGLFDTMQALEKVGIQYVGAGINKREASAPIYLDIKGKKVAVLGRTSVVVSSTSYASKNVPGVAHLEMDSTIKMLEDIKPNVDCLILCIHWGIEEYLYPSPDQREKAKKFVEAGVDLLLGHHPHVVQGVEKVQNSLVSYSSGNFYFDEFDGELIDNKGQLQIIPSKLTLQNRKGIILNVKFDGYVEDEICTPTFIDFTGKVILDESDVRKKDLKRLSYALKLPGYKWSWRFYSILKEAQLRVKPMIDGKMRWNKIKKFRFRHLKEVFGVIRRSYRIINEKSTNPYE